MAQTHTWSSSYSVMSEGLAVDRKLSMLVVRDRMTSRGRRYEDIMAIWAYTMYVKHLQKGGKKKTHRAEIESTALTGATDQVKVYDAVYTQRCVWCSPNMHHIFPTKLLLWPAPCNPRWCILKHL